MPLVWARQSLVSARDHGEVQGVWSVQQRQIAQRQALATTRMAGAWCGPLYSGCVAHPEFTGRLTCNP